MTVSTDTLEALFVINKRAKQYAQQATEAYERGYGGLAKTDSLRKEALYALKSHVLARLYLRGDVKEIQLHHIDDRKYYCFSIKEYKFHTPIDEFERTVQEIKSDTEQSVAQQELPEIAQEVTETKQIDDFTPSEQIPEEMMPEHDALKHLSTEFVSPNTFIYPFNDGRPVGWSYLPGYIEEGTTIPEPDFKTEHDGNFLLEPGDTINTIEHDKIVILDRYGKWISQRFYRDPILPRPVYDVRINASGKQKSGVREERILHEWRIHVEDPSNPIPSVSGELTDLIDSYELDFDVGDVLTLDRDFEEDPTDWRVDQISICGALLEVHLRQCNEEWAEPLVPDEFIDDIVAINKSTSTVDSGTESSQ